MFYGIIIINNMDTILAYIWPSYLSLFFLIIIFLLGLWLVFRLEKSELFLYLLLIWFPLESLILRYTPIDYFVYVKYIPELLLYGVFFAGWIFFVKRTGRLIPYRNPIFKWIILFIIVASISLFINQYHPLVWALGLRQLLRFVLVFFVIIFMDYSKSSIKKILWFGLFMLLLEAFFGIIQYAFGGALDRYLFSTQVVTIGNSAVLGGLEQFWTPGSRVFATMGRYDQLGGFLALGLIMLFPWFYKIKDNTIKFGLFTVFFTLLFALVLTYSRASWLAVIVGIFMIGVVLKKDKRIMTGFVFAMLALVLYLGFFIFTTSNALSITDKPTQSLQERVLEAVSLKSWQESYEGYGRIFFIINTPLMVVPSSPFFGVGPGNYGGGVAAALLNTEVYDRLCLPFGIQNIFGQIDNSLFSIWGEVGTVGFLVWLLMFFSLWRGSSYVMEKYDKKKLENIIEECFYVLIPAVLVLAFFGPYLEFRTLMFYFWLIAGIVSLYWRREKERGNFL